MRSNTDDGVPSSNAVTIISGVPLLLRLLAVDGIPAVDDYSVIKTILHKFFIGIFFQSLKSSYRICKILQDGFPESRKIAESDFGWTKSSYKSLSRTNLI